MVIKTGTKTTPMVTQILFICSRGTAPSSCLQDVSVPFNGTLTEDDLVKHLHQHGWFLSSLTAPGQGHNTPIVFAPICGPCAEEVMPELVEAARKHIKQ